MRAAAIQLEVSPEPAAIRAAAADLVGAAVNDGAELVVLPEMFAAFGTPEQLVSRGEPMDGDTTRWATSIARSHGIWLVAGSFPELAQVDRGVTEDDLEAAHKGDANRIYNTSCLFGPDGTLRAAYRKIHLFDISVPGAEYQESMSVVPGNEIVQSEIDGYCLAIAICYDLRFPELFVAQALAGADVVALPMAFMEDTGRDHLEPLLRARAIENGFYVIAAGLTGELESGMRLFGGTAIVGPWGEVMAACDRGCGYAIADIDFEVQAKIRAQLPVLAGRRANVYRQIHDGSSK